ncbi:MAG TPA: TraR/DksA C4-type zinc finger protein [Actinomycetota bacterium]|nr:TraR/DksA C4-type zinc finger protein [Actinomycetota bacterium]
MNESTARKLLEEERSRLEDVKNSAELETLEEGETESYQELSAVDQHTGDLGTATFEREKADSIRNSVEAQLADVDHALARLESGTYGICEMCGKTIPDERLKARPAARFCIDDQAKVERQSTIS